MTIFRPDPSKKEHIWTVIQDMIKDPELRGLEDEEKQSVMDLLNKLDKAGLVELQRMISDRLETLREAEILDPILSEARKEIEEAKIWPGRYFVLADVKDFPHRGAQYDLILELFQVDMSEEEAVQLLAPYGFTSEGEDWPYRFSYAEQTFSEEQAVELVEYLEKNYKKTRAYMRPAKEPTANQAGVGSMAVGGSDGFLTLDREPDYSLKFKVWAYYDTSSQNEPIPGSYDHPLNEDGIPF